MFEALKQKSKEFRIALLELVWQHKKGHIPSAFSMMEIVTYLHYTDTMQADDKLIISKGHAAFGLYPILADKGLIDKKEFEKFTKPQGLLRLYADNSIPGIEIPAGSLGHGIGIGVGLALVAKRDKKKRNVFVVSGDGELYEGSVWENFMFASHYELDNFVLVVDRNRLCILGDTEDCVKLESLDEKLHSFGFEVITVNGHSYEDLERGFRIVQNKNNKPKAIIADTIKAKGISFMENKPLWHNKIPNESEFEKARNEVLHLDLGV